ncbi:MAG TPA: hypothetical protein PK239_11655 [Chitinophagales bacterium]|nr:hypothetical protein [Chitinophagales bacterium]HRK27925.1 hypothetical protein [Chitinophagales bacterium]
MQYLFATFTMLTAYTPYVPPEIRRSKFYWIAIGVTVVLSILYHNLKLHRQRKTPSAHQLNNPNKQNAASIYYTNEGRSGYIHYQSPIARFKLYYAFGGGNCVACIELPKPDNWENYTGIPLSRREETLHFIGRQVVNDQTTNGAGYYKINNNSLNIYA